MGVYVKGMEMPTSCNECRFAVDGWCYAYPKQANGDALNRRVRTNWCPLIEIPSDDVVERKRGKWVGNKRHQSCSECHMTYCVPDGQDGELDMTAYHFCPNCGADMRGDDDGT